MAIAAIDEVPRPWGVLPNDRLLTAVCLITPHAALSPMQQIGQHRTVGDIGWRRHHRVDQLAAAVDPEMSLHPKVPLVALLGLMPLGIARLVGILGRRWRIDNGRIDNRAGGHFSPLAARCRCTSSNSRRPRSWVSSRWRKRQTVVSSGTGSRPRSMPTKRRTDNSVAMTPISGRH